MRYEELVTETRRWVGEGLISPDQADAIRARYQEEAPQARRSRLAQVLGIVGATALGLGVILFFAANWDGMPRGLRLAVLLLALVATYLGGFYVAEVKRTHETIGKCLFLVGTILFGASLFLVGQMYHVQAHDPLALLLWALAAAAVAAVVRFTPIATLALLVFGGWIVFELAVAHDDAAGAIPILAVLYGAALYGIGTRWWERLEPYRFATPMRRIGGALVAAGVFVFTFRFVYEGFEDATNVAGDPAVLTALVAAALAAAAGCAALATRDVRPTARWEALALGLATALVLLVVIVPEPSTATSGVDRDAVVYPILFNLLLIGIALGAIVAGSATEEVWLVNLGIALIAFEAIARYFDLFWELMPRSVVFIGFGLLLLGLAFGLERQRSRLVRRIRTG